MTFSVEIIDDSESESESRGKAELYLLIMSTRYPRNAVMLPLNVGDNLGRQNLTVTTPFCLASEQRESYIMELIDNDKKIYNQSKNKVGPGFYLIYRSGELYAVANEVNLPLEGSDMQKNLGKQLGIFVDKYSDEDYNSSGLTFYNVPKNPPRQLEDANEITIGQNNRPRIKIKVYYPVMADRTWAQSSKEEEYSPPANPLLPDTIVQGVPRSLKILKEVWQKFYIGPVIPGLQQNAIPQGMTYSDDHDLIIISHYFGHGQAPSFLSVLDNSTGKLLSSIALKESSKALHRGHVGGIAVLKDSLWVASDGQLFQYELGTVVSDTPSAAVLPVARRKCETKASFCTATENTLFVGEFAKYTFLKEEYPTDPSHHVQDRKAVKKYAWICAYDAQDILGNPKFVLSVRQKVQGMHVTNDRIYMSISYGRKNPSKVVAYENPIGEEKHATATLSNGETVPLWFLDGENYLGAIDLPPMSEGIVMIGQQLAVLFESGASKYQKGGKFPMDVMLLLDELQIY